MGEKNMTTVLFKKGLVFAVMLLMTIVFSPIGNARFFEQDTFREIDSVDNIISNNLFSYRWNARDITVRLFEIIENNGNISVNATIYLPIPCSLFSQEIYSPLKYDVIPDGYKTDRWGQEVAYYNETISPDHNFTLSWEINATIYSIRYFLLPWLVTGEIPEDIKTKYTADDTKYQINHPCIQNIVSEVTGHTNNILLKAIKLHNYIGNHLEYVLDDKWDDAPTVLQRGNGSCSEYCFVYIALLRAAGIPARYVGGTVFKTDETPYVDKVFHRIVEIYFPNYGWIPVDPTWNDYTKLPFFYFGSHQNNFLILNIGGGSSTYLDWNYCHWEEWTPASENVDVNISFTWEKWERPSGIHRDINSNKILEWLSRLK